MSGYQDSRACRYCSNPIDPLELCGCSLALADYFERTYSCSRPNPATEIRRLHSALSAIRAATVEECAKYMDENGEEGWAYNLRALLTTKPPAPDKADDELRRLGYPL